MRTRSTPTTTSTIWSRVCAAARRLSRSFRWWQNRTGIVGHILFTKLKVGQTTQLALAPLAVHPDFQRQGIGGALIEEGHRIAAQLGYDYSILLGHPTYYPRFGYQPASRFGIQSPFDVPDENYMAFDLSGRHPQMSGQVEYPPQF